MYNQDIREGRKERRQEKERWENVCFGRGFKHLFIDDEWV